MVMNRLLKIVLFMPLFCLGQSSYIEAKTFFNNQEFTVSENILKSSLIDSPNDIKTLELLGAVYDKQENWDDATLLYRKLVQIDSSNASYHYYYGKALGMKATKSNFISAFMLLDNVEYEFLKAVELDKNHIDAKWALIVYYTEIPGILGGSTKKALIYADEFKQISEVDYFLAKGYIYEEENDFALAEKNYLQAVNVGGSITCYKKLISLYENEKEYQKAIEYLELANENHQLNNFNFQIGKISALNKIDFEKGKGSLIKYINNYSLNDDEPLEWAYLYLAQIFRYIDDKSNALNRIYKALEINPTFDEALKEEILISKM